MILTTRKSMRQDFGGCYVPLTTSKTGMLQSALASYGYLHMYEKKDSTSSLPDRSFDEPPTGNNSNSLANHLSTLNLNQDARTGWVGCTNGKTRRVTFADTVGQELELVHFITAGRDTPPNFSQAFIDSLTNNALSAQKLAVALRLEFKQPISDYIVFRERLNKNNVSLENITVNELSIMGTVKVRNLAYDKNVFVRITLDNWVSYIDTTAYYVNSGITPSTGKCVDSALDTFTFQYDVPTDITSIQFAVCFRCQGQEFWDSNGGTNYRISVDNGRGLLGSPNHPSLRSKDPVKENWTEFAIWRNRSDDAPYW